MIILHATLGLTGYGAQDVGHQIGAIDGTCGLWGGQGAAEVVMEEFKAIQASHNDELRRLIVLIATPLCAKYLKRGCTAAGAEEFSRLIDGAGLSLFHGYPRDRFRDPVS